MGAKATKAQTEARIHEVFTMLVNGVTRFDIVRHAAKHWGLKSRQVDNLLARAHTLIAEEAEYHRPREIGKAKARLDQIFRQAITAKDYGAALGAQKELSKLFNLYETPVPPALLLAGITPAQLIALNSELERHEMTLSDTVEAMLRKLQKADIKSGVK